MSQSPEELALYNLAADLGEAMASTGHNSSLIGAFLTDGIRMARDDSPWEQNRNAAAMLRDLIPILQSELANAEQAATEIDWEGYTDTFTL